MRRNWSFLVVVVALLASNAVASPSVSPNTLTINVEPGEPVEGVVTLNNDGNAPVLFSVTDDGQLPSGYTVETQTVGLASFGPADLEPETVFTSWNGTETDPMDMGFSFPLFGTLYTRVSVSQDGFITLTNASGQSASIMAFRTLGGVDPTSIRYRMTAYRLVIAWDTESGQEFQAWLNPDGTMVYVYEVASLGAGTIGLLDDLNELFINDAPGQTGGNCLLFTPTPWATYSPLSGSVDQLSSLPLTFTVEPSAQQLTGTREFTATVNWEDGTSKDITVTVNVLTPNPQVAVDRNLIEFSGPPGFISAPATLILTNSGNVALNFDVLDGGLYTSKPGDYAWQHIPYATDFFLDESDLDTRPIPIGFPFEFLGTTYTSLTVGVDGTLTFENGKTIVPFSADLFQDENASVRYLTDVAQTRLTVTWENMAQLGGGIDQTFQAVLSRDGLIRFNYRQLSGEWPKGIIQISDDTIPGTLSNDTTIIVETNIIFETTYTTQWIGNVSFIEEDAQAVMTNTIITYADTVNYQALEFIPAEQQIISVSPRSGTIPVGQAVHLLFFGDARGTNDFPAATTFGIFSEASIEFVTAIFNTNAEASPLAQYEFDLTAESSDDASGTVATPFTTGPGVTSGFGYSSRSVSGRSAFFGNVGFNATNEAGALFDNDYLLFTLEVEPGFTVMPEELSFYTLRQPTTGAGAPDSYAVYSSADGFSSAIATGNIATTANDDVFTFTKNTVDMSSLTNIQSDIEFRIYLWATAGIGTPSERGLRLDELELTGITAVVPYTPPPPPTLASYSFEDVATSSDTNANSTAGTFTCASGGAFGYSGEGQSDKSAYFSNDSFNNTEEGTAFTANDYVSFDLSFAESYSGSVSALSFYVRIDAADGSGAPESYALYTSQDNYAAAVATGTMAETGDFELNTIDLSGVSSLQDIGDTEFRLYLWTANGIQGATERNFRIDTIDLQGTTTYTPYIPPAPSILSSYSFEDVATSSDTNANSTAGTFTCVSGGAFSYSGEGQIDKSAYFNNDSFNSTEEGVAFTANDYVSFDLALAEGYVASVSALSFYVRIDAADGSGAPESYALYTSQDNYTAAVATGTMAETGDFELNTIDLSGVSSLQDIGDTEFRLYLWTANGIQGAAERVFRMDELQLQGITAVVSYTPPAPPVLARYSFEDVATSSDTNANSTAGTFTCVSGGAFSYSGEGQSDKSAYFNNDSFNSAGEGAAFSANDYVSFDLALAEGYVASVSGLTFYARIDVADGSGAPESYALYTSQDNYTAAVAAGTMAETGDFELNTIDLSGVSSLQGIGDTEFRLYLWTANGIQGATERTFRIDELQLQGATTYVPDTSPVLPILASYSFEDMATSSDTNVNSTAGTFTCVSGGAFGYSGQGQSGKSAYFSNDSFNSAGEGAAFSANDYVSFDLALAEGYVASVSGLTFYARIDAADGSGASESYALYTSQDNYTAAVATGTMAETDDFELNTIDLSGVPSFLGIGDTEFRLYLWTANGLATPTERNFRIDELQLLGVVGTAPPSAPTVETIAQYAFDNTAVSSDLEANTTAGTISVNAGNSSFSYSARGQTGRSAYLNNAGFNSTDEAAALSSGDDYFSFMVGVESGYTVALDELIFYTLRLPTSGASAPNSYAVYSSVDSFSSAIATGSIATAASEVSTTFTTNTVDMSGLTNIQSSVEFRIYLWITTGIGSATEREFRFDDCTLSGLVSEETAPSEGEVMAFPYGLIEGPLGDDDQDGQNNLSEYALGGDPANAGELGEAPNFVCRNDGMISYSHVALTNAGISYVVECTDDLASGSWTNADWTSVSTNASTLDGFEEIEYQIDASKISSLYLRLRIAAGLYESVP